MPTPRRPKSKPSAAPKSRDGTCTFSLGEPLIAAIDKAARRDGHGKNRSAFAKKHLALASGFPLEKL